jgi:hypothetical protein
MSPTEIEGLKKRLREQLPISPDGYIAYESFAKCCKWPGAR